MRAVHAGSQFGRPWPPASLSFVVSHMRRVVRNTVCYCQQLTLVIAAAITCLTATSILSDETSNRLFQQRLYFQSYLYYPERTNPATWSAREHDVIMNGYRTIPFIGQFVTLFPTNMVYRFFAHEATNAHLWTMQTGLYGRHVLRMEVLFKLDTTWTNISSYEPPSFSIITWDDHWPHNERPVVLSRRSFTATDWTNLVSARGNLGAIGFKGSTNLPIPGFDAWTNPYLSLSAGLTR
jgi:hypothetical protein